MTPDPTVRGLAAASPGTWRDATSPRFLARVADGTLPRSAFDRWLEQDRLFVEALARAWARLLVRSPAPELPLLADGIASFVAEMTWLEDLAAARHLSLPAEPLPATARYLDHLVEVAEAPIPVALSALWAVEATYLEAWRRALPGAPPYRPFVEHWTSEAFAEFVERLGSAADRALASASPAERVAAGAAVVRTAELETAFWSMTYDG